MGDYLIIKSPSLLTARLKYSKRNIILIRSFFEASVYVVNYVSFLIFIFHIKVGNRVRREDWQLKIRLSNLFMFFGGLMLVMINIKDKVKHLMDPPVVKHFTIESSTIIGTRKLTFCMEIRMVIN